MITSRSHSSEPGRWGRGTAMRDGSALLQDARFGLRAAAPGPASNLSYFQNEIIEWEPEIMELV